MKKICLILILIFSFCLNVKAANNSYYLIKENGDYSLCNGKQPGCFDVSKDANGLSFYQSNVIYENITYTYNEAAQEEYDKQFYGSTKMFYYLKNDRYILCKETNDCDTYTKDSLLKKGATITTGESVSFQSKTPGGNREIYYYNASYENKETTENTPTPSKPSKEDNVTLEGSYCEKLKDPLMFLGKIVLLVKIIIPIIIIIFGVIDFFHAVVGSKDDEIKKSAKSMVFRILAGAIIFFIPTIVSFIFSLIADFANIKGDFDACQKCVFRVNSCK